MRIVGPIARILNYPHHLGLTARSRCAAEVLANRIFVSEELTREGLADNGYTSRSRRILFGDAAPSEDGGPDDVKVSSSNAIPCSEVVIPGSRIGMPVHTDAGAPTSAAQR